MLTGAPITDGSYTIGVDIMAGRWHTDGPRPVHAYGVVARAQCSWRLGWPITKDGERYMDVIVRNDDSGPADVDLTLQGVLFVTRGCKGWRPAG